MGKEKNGEKLEKDIELKDKVTGENSAAKFDNEKAGENNGKSQGSYPKHVLLIVCNEFCERFSYYGMRAVLILYIVNILGYNAADSVALFHAFSLLCYTTPLFGSILADAYIGKYHTILWISVVHALGNIMIAVSSAFDPSSKIHPLVDLLGLIIVAIGTGGIKPCVTAFGGDQFKAGQERWLETFFSIFYFSINAGSVISAFVSPMFRVMSCLNQDSCYPVAFGVPAVLMILSIVFFVFGARWYTHIPPKENIVVEVAKVTNSALKNKRSSNIKRDHWLDHHLDNHICNTDAKCMKLSKKYKEIKCHQAQFVADIKAFLRVTAMYLPVPVFWALFNLQGSRWILQGVAMDGRLWKGAILLPDQIGNINAIMIMVFIPIFQGLIYPFFRKIGIDPTPLRRMTVGGLMASGSFVIAMFVQLAVNKTLPEIPKPHEAHLAFINTLPCSITVSPTGSTAGFSKSFHVPSNYSYKLDPIEIGEHQMMTLKWKVESTCKNISSLPTEVQTGKSWHVVISSAGNGTFQSNLKKASTGEGQFKMSVNWFVANYSGPLLFCSPENDNLKIPCNPQQATNFQNITVTSMNTSGAGVWENQYVELKPKYWEIYIPTNGQWQNPHVEPSELAKHLNFTGIAFEITDQGAIYSLTITPAGDNGTSLNQNLFRIAEPNRVSLLWQTPQYIVITIGEVLLSITGLEFSYSQAPQSMKSLVTAVWLLTVAGGDLIDLVIAKLRFFDDLAWEMLLYAILMAVVIIIFALMAQFWYKYTNYTRDDEEEDTETTIDSKHP